MPLASQAMPTSHVANAAKVPSNRSTSMRVLTGEAAFKALAVTMGFLGVPA